MWRVMAAGSSTGTRRGLVLPLADRLSTALSTLRLSAVWLWDETRWMGSLLTVLLYQLNRATPSSPREFLGWGIWLVSTGLTGPTMRTVRPRLGVGKSAWGAASGACSGPAC